jgi:O-antigen/teichoic acid export membrane protein
MSEVLSSIFYFYCIGAAVVVLRGVLGSQPLIDLFRVSPEHREEYRRILILFLFGIGLAFPLGIFPEVLQGQQRIVAANNLSVLSTVANFLCVAIVVFAKLSFTTLVVLSLLCMLVPYLIAAYLAFSSMPGVRVLPRHFSWSTMLDTGRFSLFAYANTLSNVLRNKADQPIISSLIGVAQVAPFQAGSKVGEMFGQITRQIADVLSPTAAHLHAAGDKAGLHAMFTSGLRFSVLAASPIFVLCAAYMDGLIRLLTGVQKPSSEMIWAGELLLFWYYSLVLTHWVFKRMFMMAGQERRMMWQGVAEAAVNVALSLSLTFWLRSYLGVAWGSVIPTALFGWGLLWGWAAREVGLSRWQLFRRTILPTWLASIPMILLAVALRSQPWWPSGSNLFLLVAEGSAIALVGFISLWFLALTHQERVRYASQWAARRQCISP